MGERNTDMKQNRSKILIERVIAHEGGYVNNPNDRGGPTKYGITQKTYNAWRRSKGLTASSVRNMPQLTASHIYAELYWPDSNAESLPIGLDQQVFEATVMSGPGTAIKILQSTFNYAFTYHTGATLAVDGIWGRNTEAAASKIKAEYYAIYTEIIEVFYGKYLIYLRSLGEKTWEHFGKGWENRLQSIKRMALADASDSLNVVLPTPAANDLTGALDLVLSKILDKLSLMERDIAFLREMFDIPEEDDDVDDDDLLRR